MALKSVFVRSSAVSDVVRVEDFILSVDPVFQSSLRQAALQLAESGRIEGFRASLLPNGDWSLWLEDPSGLGSRVNFVLYVSSVEVDVVSGAERVLKSSRLGVRVQHGQAQGAWEEFLPADVFIERNFSGDVASGLRRALDLAMTGREASEVVEWTSDGAVLRALSAETQVRQFDAELRVYWE